MQQVPKGRFTIVSAPKTHGAAEADIHALNKELAELLCVVDDTVPLLWINNSSDKSHSVNEPCLKFGTLNGFLKNGISSVAP